MLLLERGIPHQCPVKSSESAGYGSEGAWGSVGGENQPALDIATAPPGAYLLSVSSESSVDSDLSAEGGDPCSSYESAPVSMIVRPSTFEAESHRWDLKMARSLGEPERRRERSIKKQLAS